MHLPSANCGVMNKLIGDLIKRLLRARKNQLALFKEKPALQQILGYRLVGQMFMYLLLPPCVALFLFGYAIFYGSLEAFGGAALIVAFCVISYVPYLRWYLSQYEK